MKNKILLSMSAIMLLCLATGKLYSQTSILGNTQVAPANFLGWDNLAPANPLNILTQWPQPINFYTNGTAFPWVNLRMQIFDGTGAIPNAGFVGIDNGVGGYFSIPPQWQLDVRNDINLHSLASAPNPTYNSGYRINNNLVLYLPGDAPGGGLFNTFVGRTGNLSITPGQRNTFLGFGAGTITDILTKDNVFVGYNAGTTVTQNAHDNVFVGSGAGELAFRPAGCAEYSGLFQHPFINESVII